MGKLQCISWSVSKRNIVSIKYIVYMVTSSHVDTQLTAKWVNNINYEWDTYNTIWCSVFNCIRCSLLPFPGVRSFEYQNIIWNNNVMTFSCVFGVLYSAHRVYCYILNEQYVLLWAVSAVRLVVSISLVILNIKFDRFVPIKLFCVLRHHVSKHLLISFGQKQTLLYIVRDTKQF